MMDSRFTPAQSTQRFQTEQAPPEIDARDTDMQSPSAQKVELQADAQTIASNPDAYFHSAEVAHPVEALSVEVLPAKQTAAAAQCAEPFIEDLIQPHFAILQLGVSIWNQWRLEDPHIIPDLQGADLRGLKLENINLSRANLRGAQLDNAYLFDADFQRADLRGASLVRAMLVGANLHSAKLSDTNLEHAYLNHCDLSNANLTGANLQEAELRHALLTEATLVNARLASAEMLESDDLTARQLQVAKDVHLAFLSGALKARLRGLSQIRDGGRSASSLPKQVRPRQKNKTAGSASISEQLIPSIEIKFQPKLAV